MADLDTVRNTCGILIDMVGAATSYDELKNATSLQLVVNCREMHRRIMGLIEIIPEESLLLELLQLNDELFAAINYFDKFKSGKKEKAPAKPSKPAMINVAAPPQQSKPSSNLFALDDLLGSPVNNAAAAVPINLNNNPFAAPPTQQPIVNTANQAYKSSMIDPIAQQFSQPAVQQQPASNPFDFLGFDQPANSETISTPSSSKPLLEQQETDNFVPLLPPPPAAAAKKQSHPSDQFASFLDNNSQQQQNLYPSTNTTNNNTKTFGTNNSLFSLDD